MLKECYAIFCEGPYPWATAPLEESQSCLSITQTIIFNCKKGKSSGVKHRHSLNLEPPLPLHIGLSIHTKSRSKKLITELYELGLCVSYDRILQLENKLTTSICEHTREIGLVCPIQLHHKLFTVGALDNIDQVPAVVLKKEEVTVPES